MLVQIFRPAPQYSKAPEGGFRLRFLQLVPYYTILGLPLVSRLEGYITVGHKYVTFSLKHLIFGSEITTSYSLIIFYIKV